MGDLNYDCWMSKPAEIACIESIFEMYQLVSEPTRVTNHSRSLIDVILSSIPALHNETRVIENAVSDHYPVVSVVALDTRRSSHNTVCFRDYKRFDENMFLHDMCVSLNNYDLLNIDVSQYDLSACDPIAMWEKFKNAFIKVSDTHAPFKSMRLRHKHKPWVTREVIDLMHRRDHAHKRAVRSKSTPDWDEYRMLRNLVTAKIRTEKRKYFHRKFIETKDDPKEMWKTINKALCKDVHESPPSDITANDFNDFFSSIGQKTIAESISTDALNSDFPWKNPPCLYRFKFTHVKPYDVSKLIKKLSNESSCDVLGFDEKLLFLANDFITPVLTLIINASLYHGILHPDWKHSRVTPVYKGKGSKSECTNYRPISVITHVAKIIERIVQKQLLTYLVSHDLINNDQSAFRPNHSTQTALHRVIDSWLDNINDGLLTGVCFLDIRKCFDTIDHNVLIRKMYRYGICDVELEWFHNYLSCRSQIVKHKGLSDVKTVDVGIPQGSSLGPTIFLLFVNDISQFVLNGTCNLYADDAVIYCQGKNIEEVQKDLQCCITTIHEWYCKNRLSLNAKKCEVMIVKSKRSTASDQLDIKIDNVILDQVKCARYLGLDIDTNLSWNDYVTCLVRKISFKLAQLRRLRPTIPKYIAERIYVSTVQPCIDYAISVWGQTSVTNIKKIQRMQNYAARIVVNNFDYINVRGANLVKELHWMNVKDRCSYFTCILTFKCLHSLAPNYVCDDFTLNCDTNFYSTRSHPMNVVIPKCHRSCFKFNASILWNQLPTACKNAHTLGAFKYYLKRHILSDSHCL